MRGEIALRKHSYYTKKVQYLKSNDPKKWWDYIRQITGKKKSSANISIIKDGVTTSGIDLVDMLNDYFSSISADLSSLDLNALPAFLPAPDLPPTITHVEVCSKLLKVKSFKAHGPDSIPSWIIREYAIELAEPMAKIFNQSLSSSKVPTLWKDADLTPVPKTQAVICENELQSIALTASLSKVVEDFVVTWLFQDTRHKIDIKQFGSLKGSSTTFCLIDMINNCCKHWIPPHIISESVSWTFPRHLTESIITS